MSSTVANKPRNPNDYYATPTWVIKQFLEAWQAVDNFTLSERFDKVLDPCSGGDSNNLAPYPAVLESIGLIEKQLLTYDVREDAQADVQCDYLNHTVMQEQDLIISNPPFSLALEFIKKALQDTSESGCVVMLLRANFLGSQKRDAFFKKHPPTHVFYHAKRISFSNGGTDSTDYAHFVWDKSKPEPYPTVLHRIPTSVST